MKIYISLIILFCTFCSTELLSQENIYSIYNSKKSSNTFQYKGELLQFPDMNEIFKQDILAHKQYVYAMDARQNAKILGYTTFGTMTAGILALTFGSSAENCEFLCISSTDAFGLISILLVTPIVGTAALISNTKYHKKKHKAISLFNNSMGMGYIDNPKSWDLKVGSGQYGYGLVVNF